MPSSSQRQVKRTLHLDDIGGVAIEHTNKGGVVLSDSFQFAHHPGANSAIENSIADNYVPEAKIRTNPSRRGRIASATVTMRNDLPVTSYDAVSGDPGDNLGRI
jgi:hypothetical protein